MCEFSGDILSFAGVFLSVRSLALASRTLGGDASWAIGSTLARGRWWLEEREYPPRARLVGHNHYAVCKKGLPTSGGHGADLPFVNLDRAGRHIGESDRNTRGRNNRVHRSRDPVLEKWLASTARPGDAGRSVL